MRSDSLKNFTVTVMSLIITQESAGKEIDIVCTSLHCCPTGTSSMLIDTDYFMLIIKQGRMHHRFGIVIYVSHYASAF